MTPRDRKKPAGRRPGPGVEGLEPRQMLTASTSAIHPIAAISVESAAKTTHVTAHHATASKGKHVSTESVQAKAHALAKKVSHVSAAVVKPTTHAAKTVKATGLALNKLSNRLNLAFRPGEVVKGRILASSSPNPSSFAPSQVAKAYGVNLLGVANQGQGQTIGIVDEDNDPNILNDVNVFSAQYGLPAFTTSTLTVYKDTTYGSVPNVPVGTGIDIETSLDVEWAHAMAPKAKILLVEVPAPNADYPAFVDLLHGIQYAAAQPGVGVVSLSYGNPENYIGAVSTLNKQYLATGPSFNVAVTVSAGDSEYPGFPSSSPNVISVGGTALHISDSSGTYNYETSWGGSATNGSGGGGYSSTFAAPTFQKNNQVQFPIRTLPDVSAIADPATGVNVYDSYAASNGQGWYVIGGTSLAAPVTAGIISLAQQDRTALNKPVLNSTQINNLLYKTYTNPTDYANYFHDIITGSNSDYEIIGFDQNDNPIEILVQPGYIAKTGYDFATGLGSIKANTVVPYLTNA